MNLFLTESAQKDLAQLDSPTRGRIKDGLNRLMEHPKTLDLKKLKGQENRWRLRVGDYRVILEMHEPPQTVYVLRIRHRKEAYR
ncbi:MAG: type II toxin-antitoxin system RelE/ParE family toxin [Syntrophobacteraceae bacterium]